MSIDTPLPSIRSPAFAPFCIGAVALGVVVLLLHETAAAMVTTWWRSVTFQHCFLILPICAYLAWIKREAAANTAITPAYWGIVFVAVAAIVWLVGHVTATRLIEEASLIAIAESIYLTIFGWPLFKVFIFPLGYLWFVIPAGLEFVPFLQDHTASMAVSVLKFAGVPVYSDGNLIQIPGENFYVAEACSGIRYLIASTALGVLVAGMTYRSWWRRGAFLAASVIVPIFANGLRAATIILLAYFVDDRLATGVDHLIYGWVFFTLVTFLTIAIGMSFRENPITATGLGRFDAAFTMGHRDNLRHLILPAILAFTPLILVCSYSRMLDQARPSEIARLYRPIAHQPWHEVFSFPIASMPKFAGADDLQTTTYTKGNIQANATIGFYTYDREGAKAVGSQHELLPPGGSMITASGSTGIVIDGNPVTAHFQRSTLGSGSTSSLGRRSLFLFYWVDGRFTGNPYLAKLLAAKAKLLGGRPASAAIALTIDYEDDAAEAERELRDLAAHLQGLGNILEQASQ